MEHVNTSESEKLIAKTSSSESDFFAAVKSLPLVQLFSVYVHVETPSEVYGLIRATEVNGITFDIYDRDRTDPETISNISTLSLSGPDNDPILGVTGVSIDVCLKDRNTTTDIELIKGQFYLDPTIEGTEKSYDKLLKASFQGQRASACLYYTIFRCAVYTTVEVTITEKTDTNSIFADIYGSVVACYATKTYSISDDESKYLDTVLFEKPSSRPVRVMVGTPVKLLRSVVVVPLYSRLIIKANIFDTKVHFASGDLEFRVDDSFTYTKSIMSGNGCVQVKVTTRNAYSRIYDREIFKRCTSVLLSDGTQSRECKVEEPSKKAKVCSYELLPPSLKPVGSARQVSKKSKIKGSFMVEVFSVFVDGIHRELSAICGSIEVLDGTIPFFIYERSCSDSEVVPDDKMLCIQGNTPITNCDFRMFIDLKDPILNLEISNGMISWVIHESRGFSWFGKRICSAHQGVDGYAAFHYMIFYSAVSAIVEVTFFSDNFDGVTPNVYGVILARYGGHEYATEYDKKYYQSILFKRQQKNAEQVKTNSRIPLSKSQVAINPKSWLVVEANLKVIYNDNSSEEVVFGIEEFTVDMSDKIHKKIQGGTCYIDVSVNFCMPYESRKATI